MRMSKKKKLVKELYDAGNSVEEIVKKTGLKEKYVINVIEELQQKQEEKTQDDTKNNSTENNKMNDAIQLNINNDILEVKKENATQEVIVQKQDVKHITLDSETKTQETNSDEELEQLRKSTARSITIIEKALFKSLANVELLKEEEEMLLMAWRMMSNMYIKDTNASSSIAVGSLLVAHATIIISHEKEIRTALDKRKKQVVEVKQEEVKETEQKNEETTLVKPLPIAK